MLVLISPRQVHTGIEFSHITGPANVALAQEVGELYQAYKRGELTKGQYDGRRAKLRKQLSNNLGFLEKRLLRGQTTQQAFRINRFKNMPVTHNISAYAAHLNRLSSYATYGGGIVLTSIGGKLACDDIAETDNRQQKNEIFVEYVTSTAAGSTASIALGVFMVTTPVGWAVALGLGAAAGFGSMAVGKGMAKLYSMNFEEYDLVSGLGVDQLCK